MVERLSALERRKGVTDTLKPTEPLAETFSAFLARLRAQQAERGIPLPKPATNEVPPPAHQDPETP